MAKHGNSWEASEGYGYNVEAHGFLTSLGFEDTTWVHDGCPSFHHHGLGLRLWIEATDPSEREIDGDRLLLARYDSEMDFKGMVAETEDWLVMAKILREKVQ